MSFVCRRSNREIDEVAGTVRPGFWWLKNQGIVKKKTKRSYF